MRRARRLIVGGAALLVAQSTALVARAGDADKGAAQALFEQGRSLVQDKKFAEACPKFVESLRLDPGIGTMLWLADCYENSGKTASAWAEFKEAAASATLRQDSRAALARRRADELEPKLAKLLLIPPPGANVAGLEVMRDGAPIGVAELGLAVPVNPGVHVISVGATGKKTWSTSISVVDKPGTVSVPIPVLEAAPQETGEESKAVPVISGANPARPQVTEEKRPQEKRTWGPRQTTAVAAGATGIVALGIGSFFGLDARSTYDSWHGNPMCAAAMPSGACVQQRGAASTQADAADVLFGVGAAALVAGAVLYLTAPKAPTGTVGISPTVSPRSAGVAVSSAW